MTRQLQSLKLITGLSFGPRIKTQPTILLILTSGRLLMKHFLGLTVTTSEEKDDSKPEVYLLMSH